jgi:hypothetical protein
MTQPPEGSNPQDPQSQDPQFGQGPAPEPTSSGYGAQDPYGQQSAAAPGQQDAWGAQSAPSASQPEAAPSPVWGSAQSPSAAPQGGGAAQAGGSSTGEAGFFKALFDFRFEHFITVKFSSFLYIIAFIVAGLMWLMNIIWGIAFGAVWGNMNSFYGEGGFNAFPLVFAILFGWIPSVISLIAMRLGLEFAVATVRTAQNTSRIAESAQKA